MDSHLPNTSPGEGPLARAGWAGRGGGSWPLGGEETPLQPAWAARGAGAGSTDVAGSGLFVYGVCFQSVPQQDLERARGSERPRRQDKQRKADNRAGLHSLFSSWGWGWGVPGHCLTRRARGGDPETGEGEATRPSEGKTPFGL